MHRYVYIYIFKCVICVVHVFVLYRAVMASETERLTGLSEFWELRFDDSSIPEESERAVQHLFIFF